MIDELGKCQVDRPESGLEEIKGNISDSYGRLSNLKARLEAINARLNGESVEVEVSPENAPSRAGVNGEILDLNDLVAQVINHMQEEVETIERFI